MRVMENLHLLTALVLQPFKLDVCGDTVRLGSIGRISKPNFGERVNRDRKNL